MENAVFAGRSSGGSIGSHAARPLRLGEDPRAAAKLGESRNGKRHRAGIIACPILGRKMRFLAKKRTLKMQLNIFGAPALTMMAHFIGAKTVAFPEYSVGKTTTYLR